MGKLLLNILGVLATLWLVVVLVVIYVAYKQYKRTKQLQLEASKDWEKRVAKMKQPRSKWGEH